MPHGKRKHLFEEKNAVFKIEKCLKLPFSHFAWQFLSNSVELVTLESNKPGTAEVGAISKAQNCKRGTPWAL